MKNTLRLVVLIGLIAGSAFGSTPDSPAPISFVLPGGSVSSPETPAPIKVIIDTGFVAYDNKPVPPSELVSYLNSMLKSEKTHSIAVYIRQGVKFGEVVKSLDELRKTDAKAIGVSMTELAPNQSL